MIVAASAERSLKFGRSCGCASYSTTGDGTIKHTTNGGCIVTEESGGRAWCDLNDGDHSAGSEWGYCSEPPAAGDDFLAMYPNGFGGYNICVEKPVVQVSTSCKCAPYSTTQNGTVMHETNGGCVSVDGGLAWCDLEGASHLSGSKWGICGDEGESDSPGFAGSGVCPSAGKSGGRGKLVVKATTL